MTMKVIGASKTVGTSIMLPPADPSAETLRLFLVNAFERFRWFAPMWYGTGKDKRVDPEQIDYDAMVEFYGRRGTLFVSGNKGEQEYLMISPSRSKEYPYVGVVSWTVHARHFRQASWRAAHVQHVMELMHLFNSPLAVASLKEDIYNKTQRLVPVETWQRLAFTVRDYSEGLAGLFWRNFYGPPFVRLFGERLEKLPPECVTRLEKELVLVQPYELPTEAGSEAGRERARQLIAMLGPECFYDHVRHEKPTRRPELPRLIEA